MLNAKWGVLEQYPFYRAVGSVVLQCRNAANTANASCGAPGAVYQYSALQTPNSVTTGLTSIDGNQNARREQQILPASTWQIKLGVRVEF